MANILRKNINVFFHICVIVFFNVLDFGFFLNTWLFFIVLEQLEVDNN